MVVVNEYVKFNNERHFYSYKGIKSIHTGDKSLIKCSWICHNNTSFCKNYHVKFKNEFFKITDPFYFGFIGLLKGTGNYGLANILFLVLIIPFLIIYMSVKGFNYKTRIKSLTQNLN